MTLSEMREVKAIDFHSHFGEWNMGKGIEEAQRFMPGGVDYLKKNMELSNIAVSINSNLHGLMPRGGGDAVEGNRRLLKAVEQEKNILMWAVVNPLQPETFSQAAELLKHPKCFGIKVHPEEHRYPITAYGEKIYEFAAKNNAVIETHSGEGWSMPEDFCILANRYPEVITIVSHMGCGWDGAFDHQIRAVQRSVNHNLFTDTSSAKSITCNLIEFGVKELGSENILFGTDSACYFSPMQRARIDCAHIGDDDKLNILYRNALRIFPRLQELYEANQ